MSRRLEELGIEPDLLRWTDSLMSDRKVRLVLEGREEKSMHEVETGVPQGSPVAPILFTAYLSGVFDCVEGLSFVDDVAWWAEGKSEKKVARTLSNAAEATLDWAENGVAYDKAKAEVMFLSKRRKNHTESVRVTMKSSATNTLGIWIAPK